jgi:hypothetical protein
LSLPAQRRLRWTISAEQPNWTLNLTWGTKTTVAAKTYDELKAKVQELTAAGRLPSVPTRDQRIDFAYGNTKIENDAVTREMVVKAVDAKSE